MRSSGIAWCLISMMLLATATSCRPPAAQSHNVPAGTAVLQGAGATFPAPLLEKWFAEYGKQHRDVVIAYDAVGSGEGIRRFIGLDPELSASEHVDFGVSEAALSDADMKHPSRSVQLVPITAGAVVLAYNLPDFQGALRLSRDAMAGIFLGEITRWNDPVIRAANDNAALPDMTIRLVTRRDSSGTTFTFTNHLAAISPAWRNRYGAVKLVDWPGAAMTALGNEGVAGKIRQAVGSVGYVEQGFAERLGLKMVALENKAGEFIAPTRISTTAALAHADLPDNLRLFFSDPEGQDAYPIITLSWIMLYRDYGDAKKAAALRDLFSWCLADGQLYSEELGYIRLPANVASAAATAVKTVGPR